MEKKMTRGEEFLQNTDARPALKRVKERYKKWYGWMPKALLIGLIALGVLTLFGLIVEIFGWV